MDSLGGVGVRGAMLTTLVAWSLLAGFIALQRVLRRGEEARSLQASAADRGSTKLLGAAFLLGALALVAAPVLNAQGIAGASHGPIIGWIGVAVMVGGLALRLWSQAGNRSRVEWPCFLGFFSTARVNYHALLPPDATSGA
jgi:hypothetical protein